MDGSAGEARGQWAGRAARAFGAGVLAAAAVASLVRGAHRLRRSRRRLSHAALHDPLTGLANRTLLDRCLSEALANAAAAGHLVGVLFCDLDGFKRVNDSHGHGAGDLLLTLTALRMSAAVRPTDTVARCGGDEFVVVCPALPPSAADAAAALETIAGRIRRAVAQPNDVAGMPVSLTVSIGAAVSVGGTAADLLRRADRAMYRAKGAGGAVAGGAAAGRAAAGGAAAARLSRGPGFPGTDPGPPGRG